MRNFILFCILMVIFNSCETTIYPSTRNVYPNKSSNVSERNEFESLMKKDKIGKIQRNGEVVNQLINERPGDKMAAITVKNNTKCDIIVRISGAKNYLLPVYKNDKNFILIDKGNYTFSSNFCIAKYYKQKSIAESVVITLSER